MKGTRYMKIYEILDEENKINIGVLLYFEKKKEFIIELQSNIDEWMAPLLFTNLVKNQIYTVPRKMAYMWVKERIIPSGRQNISEILKNHKMEVYDEMKFLELSKGKCSQDSMYIRKIDELPEYVIERRKRNVVDLVVCDGWKILCFFENDIVKRVDMTELSYVDGISKIINNKKLYQSCKVGTGGYSITFDDAIDISSSILYEHGDILPVSRNDFICFARNNLLDTSECCELLECSRQNVSYMIRHEQLNPIKEDIKGNLYLKGEVVKNMW